MVDEVEVKSKASAKKVVVEPIETKEENIPKEMIKTTNMSPCLAKYMKKDQKNFRRRVRIGNKREVVSGEFRCIQRQKEEEVRHWKGLGINLLG